MVFSSGVFLFLFLPGLLIMYYSAKSRAVRNYILLITSLLFYAWGEPVFVFIMLASIFLNWKTALIMSSSPRPKLWLTLAISLDVLLLGIFKYTGFVTENLAFLTGGRTSVIRIALPIGISFFTFQMMSYVFDVYYGKSKAQEKLSYVALYISFFPQLIAGPIVRYNQIEAEITERHENFGDFAEGARRFIYGLGKKVLLANFVAQIADNVFAGAVSMTVMMSWLGVISYAFQVYFDFSGYSDMAIGLGLMFGFHFEENFNYPYTASSIANYWHRWHISLSTWFKDYVYIPLGGSRVPYYRWLINLSAVWFLTGIWHGANWTFIIWGQLFFVLLVIEKETKIASRLGNFARIYTLLVVLFARVLYKSNNLSSAISYMASMLGLKGNALYDSGFIEYIKGSWTVLAASFIGIFPAVKILRRYRLAEAVYLCAVFIICVLEITVSSYNPFIYFNF